MSAVIFAGPSIRKSDLRAVCDAVILPPAAMGDIYRAARQRPRAIGLIDGYFEGAPSVWHKEILWAMAEGVEVFGASSMGALRGAELASFGMRGIGAICAGFLSGRLEDDDEVAVEHGPAELDYIALSEPMVNIRATLDRAAARGIISEGLAGSLTAIAKQQFYKERSWQSLLRLAPTGPELDSLAQWLPGNVVDLKRDDAVKMALAMAQFLAASRRPEPKDFAFQWTVMWDKATRSFTSHDIHATTDLDMAAAVLDELRLDPDTYSAMRRGAIARKLADGGLTDHAPIEETAMRQEISRFREKHGLMTHNALMSWLKDNGLDASGFEKLVADEIRLDRLAGADLDRHMLAELQFAGLYSALARRAREKRALLDRNTGDGHSRPGRLQIMQARLWYFESVLGRPVPDDMANYAGDMGFADVEALDSALLHELAFRRLAEGARE